MTDMPPPPMSSQDSGIVCHSKHKMQFEQENQMPTPPASSPPTFQDFSGNLLHIPKIKKPPTVTPKRFTKFFTPRSSMSTRAGRQSKAGRQLQDITRNGSNCRRTGLNHQDDFTPKVEDDGTAERLFKRRKISTDLPSSPPQSSPLEHVQATRELPVFHDQVPGSPTISEADTLPELFEKLKPFPKPIRRLREPGRSRRLLERSFGGYDANSRGLRGVDHAVDARAETANFVTTPSDMHPFRGAALPFCTAACNTNSLIAVGDEEGSVRLIDSASSAQFSASHVKFRVHHNAVMDIAFCSDDYVLATASGDQTARVVDMYSQQTVSILQGHQSSVKQVRFQPGNDNMVTTSARDGTVRLWDLRASGRSAVQSFRDGVDRGEEMEPQTMTSQELHVGYGHRSTTRKYEMDERNELSITSFQHLPHGRSHLIVTASEVNASVKIWDLRNAGFGQRNASPLASTPLPETHRGTRHYGINSMALSGDGARLYTVCRDATVYAYSTNQLALGYVPEMSSGPSRRRMMKDPKAGLGPLYGFRHPNLRIGTFYIKAAIRPAKGDHGEMLAVGNTDKCPILFPTDERHLPKPERIYEDAEEDEDDLPTAAPSFPRSSGTTPSTGLQVHEHGTALVRAHNKEVTSLAWTTNGNLITVSDDFSARCWREDAAKARELRGMGEVGGGRWRSGWADVRLEWDEEEG
ncbi:Cell division cycle protein cdt2 [Fulvia fulva]|uniref:Cell division cycle protein cdt2 n=1 Tax=Passalora fulva TaxID=5499 RepID=A0A9Q8P588_PASFU|nr:Cell division cycle protein cdt2 [Fulvia fulva]KAK4631121.1 Cell division cycle protein cdt2 [Fulvia fulva]KAK4633546.1 Cell division cycle protein cdt2 [Fulvia fulva]UJO13636.1 Cell division cycle protein cdt2 [Fulvia fulva]WPV10502.1 Cell division cycle protein cdt2 [Fulvia fulva]WPV25574.1 Cell division cycle protein cdt2 [Fulvia fulva]